MYSPNFYLLYVHIVFLEKYSLSSILSVFFFPLIFLVIALHGYQLCFFFFWISYWQEVCVGEMPCLCPSPASFSLFIDRHIVTYDTDCVFEWIILSSIILSYQSFRATHIVILFSGLASITGCFLQIMGSL